MSRSLAYCRLKPTIFRPWKPPVVYTRENFLYRQLKRDGIIKSVHYFKVGNDYKYALFSCVQMGAPNNLNKRAKCLPGGIAATLLDQSLFLAVCGEEKVGKITSSLTVNHKALVPNNGSRLIIESWIEKRDARKIWARGNLYLEGGMCPLIEGEGLFTCSNK